MKNILKIMGVGLIVFIIAVMFFNLNQPKKVKLPDIATTDSVTVKGQEDAKHQMIVYTDLFCSHCNNFKRASVNPNFNKDFIETGKLKYEVKLLAMFPERDNDYTGAEMMHCAQKQGKDDFWQFYNLISEKLHQKYFSKGIGVSKTSPQIENLELNFYLEEAKNTNLDINKLTNCVQNHDTKADIDKMVASAVQKGFYGVPTFLIDGEPAISGFGEGYDYLTMMLKSAGIQ